MALEALLTYIAHTGIIKGHGGRFLSEISRDTPILYGEIPHLRDNRWYTGAPPR